MTIIVELNPYQQNGFNTGFLNFLTSDSGIAISKIPIHIEVEVKL